MADSASELESDASSVDGGPTSRINRPIQIEQLQKRAESLQQQNAVLKEEVETWKLRYKNLQEENKELRKASVTIQARAEQEEEFISNTLLKKIQELRREKEKLAMNYEQEEECLTNDLSRKLTQLRQEKMELEQNLAREQEHQITKLKRRIERLEADTKSKQTTLEKLKKEKVELENSLEQEQEALVNKLWKRMGKLENEKRLLQEKLEEPVSCPSSPRDMPQDGDLASNLSKNIQHLNQEVARLRNQLSEAQTEHNEKMAKYHQEEHKIRESNLRLQRKLQLEMERREQLCRTLSESESSLEMDEERIYNEQAKQMEMKQQHLHTTGPHSHPPQGPLAGTSAVPSLTGRPRTVSSPIPMQNSAPAATPGLHYGSAVFSPTSPMRSVGVVGIHPSSFLPSTSPPVFSHPSIPPQNMHQNIVKVRPMIGGDKFVKPTALPPPKSPSPVGGPPSPMQTGPTHGASTSPAQSPARSQSPMQVDTKAHSASSHTDCGAGAEGGKG